MDYAARVSNRPTLKEAAEVLRTHFGYPEFRPGQERAIERVFLGLDTLVVLPTGGGKSLCFQVPAFLLTGITVVVSPLISLMKDQVDALRKRRLPATFINSTLTNNEVSDRLARVELGEFKLLYVAPERLDSGSLAARLGAQRVSLLVVDEAHCISEWGFDFRPSYLRLLAARRQLGFPPTIALTATATPPVRRDIVKHLRLRSAATIITGFDRNNLEYNVVHCRRDSDKNRVLVDLLRRSSGPSIVYAPTRRAVDRIARMLRHSQISAAAYHAGLDDVIRRDVQDDFMSESGSIIVATNAFGMGIDKANVRTVVHYAMPGTLEAYYQEAGRAGRDGRASMCYLLHAYQDRFTHEFFIASAYPKRGTIELVHDRLQLLDERPRAAPIALLEIFSLLGARVKRREAESALRILGEAGTITLDPVTSDRLWVRLLATPQRIGSELGPADVVERDLLRALWRGVGATLCRGALIDPAGLPPGFGGADGVTTILARLASRQFVTWERTGGGIRLASPGSSLSASAIDWATLHRRQRAEMSKLDVMQRYAFSRGCRRAFILRYFGDSAAASSECRGCDNCLRAGKRAARSAG